MAFVYSDLFFKCMHLCWLASVGTLPEEKTIHQLHIMHEQ